MWTYRQPTELVFGPGTRSGLAGAVARWGTRPVLVTDAALAALPLTGETLERLGPDAALFAEVMPNPTLGAVDALAETLRAHAADVVVALGGGSSLDCAKAASAVALQGGPAARFHRGEAALDDRHLPVIALPTTAGTGSEVTSIAVLDDPERERKAPLAHPAFFPVLALVDPEFTLTLPRPVTASTGLDALSHAIEGYWSNHHQPICDALALQAVGLVFTHLPRVLADGSDAAARAGMSLAALLAGMAFHVPKNAAVHACSFPLSSRYHQPHGVACALTLDAFVKFNAPALGSRGAALASAAGFPTMEALAAAILELKIAVGLPTRLTEVGVLPADLDALVAASFAPLMNNNPRPVTPALLRELYLEIM
jgi:alcohol dehydrogenase